MLLWHLENGWWKSSEQSQSLTENPEESSLDKTCYNTCLGKGQHGLECLEGMKGYNSH